MGPSASPRPLPLHPALFGGRTLGCCWPRGSPCAQEAQGAGPALAAHGLGMAETTCQWWWHEIAEEVIQIQRNFFSFPFQLLKETMKNNPLAHAGHESLCKTAAMGGVVMVSHICDSRSCDFTWVASSNQQLS